MAQFSSRILDWYDVHARKLPWRIAPADGAQGIVPDPYHIWLSEVMLQQTTVTAVKSYFDKFLHLWPTVNDLSAASQEDVMKAWAGLGYYSRARNLKACADVISKEMGGKFPQTRAELIKLPGIGDYTASAIAAIAFGERAAVVDGNVERVLSRHREINVANPALKNYCRTIMDRETPADRPGDFVQAVMDLGATICTPRNPACTLCPINENCSAYKAGTALDYPAKKQKKQKPTRRGAAYLAVRQNDGAIWLQKRPDKGLLGGMTSLPTTHWTVNSDGAVGPEHGPCPADWTFSGTVRHTFTHFHLELEVWQANACPGGEGWWSRPNELSTEALPSVMRKAVTLALPEALKPQP